MVGLIHVSEVRKAIEDQADSLDAYIDRDVPTVNPEEALSSLFGLFDGRSIPIAVVEESGKLAGVIVKGAILSELAKLGEDA